MATLQVRDLPEHIYQKIVERAAAERRSISQQTIILLEQALALTEKPTSYRIQLLDQILKETSEEKHHKDIPDPVPLIREERDK